MQATKDRTHFEIARRQRKGSARTPGPHQRATAKDKKPPEQFDPAMHEKACRVQRAAVKEHPKSRQSPCWQEVPSWAGRAEQTGNEANEKGGEQSLRNARRGGRPKGLRVSESLPPNQENRTRQTEQSSSRPKTDKALGRAYFIQPTQT